MFLSTYIICKNKIVSFIKIHTHSINDAYSYKNYIH